MKLWSENIRSAIARTAPRLGTTPTSLVDRPRATRRSISPSGPVQRSVHRAQRMVAAAARRQRDRHASARAGWRGPAARSTRAARRLGLERRRRARPAARRRRAAPARATARAPRVPVSPMNSCSGDRAPRSAACARGSASTRVEPGQRDRGAEVRRATPSTAADGSRPRRATTGIPARNTTRQRSGRPHR